MEMIYTYIKLYMLCYTTIYIYKHNTSWTES
jgi:hypothetical protein